MDQTVKAGLQLDKRAVLLQLYDLALHDLADRVLLVDDGPRLRRGLLQAQGDLALFLVHGKDFHPDLLPDLEDLLRMAQLAPADLGDVQETVDAAQIDERTVVGEPHDGPFHDFTHLEACPGFLHPLALLLRQNGLMREHGPILLLVHAGYLDHHLLSQELIGLLDITIRKLGQRNEAGNLFISSDHTTVYQSHDLHRQVRSVLVGFQNLPPVLVNLQLLLREQDAAVPVLGFDDLCLNLVTLVEQVSQLLIPFQSHLFLRDNPVLLDAHVNDDFFVRDLVNFSVNSFSYARQS